MDGLDLIGDVIVGHARDVNGWGGCPHPGYFVIDTSANEHWLELSKDEFDARCKALGIVPELKPPSYYRK